MTVTEHNFDASLVVVTVNGAPLTDLVWTHDGDVHTARVLFSEDAHYTFDVSAKDLALNENTPVDYGTSVSPTEFTVDNTKPTDLKITYEPTVTFVETLLELVTLGFYNAPVTVTLEATDVMSGIDFFRYSYAVQSGASSVNAGKTDVEVSSAELSFDGDRAYVSFEIPAQFRGSVSFSAVDRSGNETMLKDDKIIVVDTVAPDVTVEFDLGEYAGAPYFSATRTATVKVKESNFFADDIGSLLVITVNGETVTPVFTADEETEDLYVAVIPFAEEGDYEFDIKYTDRAGNVYDDYEPVRFTVDKTAPAIEVSFDKNDAKNETCFVGDRTATVTVTEHNFDASLVVGSVFANGTELPEYAALLSNPDAWTHDGDKHTLVLPVFSDDAHYTFAVSCKDLALNENAPVDYGASVSPTEFTVDNTKPTDLKISYEPSATLLDKLLEGITFGFYDAPVKVVLEATDLTAGVDFFTYEYKVEEGASTVNLGGGGTITEKEITYKDGIATASFTVPAQFRGNVSFTASDRAGNESNLCRDNNVIVVDTVAPGITVQYDSVSGAHGNYYNTERTATVRIEEANFFEKDVEEGLLVITVTRVLNDGTRYEETVKPVFTKDGDVYTATILFAENADYTFDIKYTDRAGNVYDDYAADEFTVDLIDPELTVSFDNNSAKNGDQFKNDRTATVTVIEHNFDASLVDVMVEANGVVLPQYTEQLHSSAVWTHNGDVHTATVYFPGDNHYTFAISCKDLARNGNEGVDFGDSVAPDHFTVDVTAPTGLSITVGERSVLGTNNVVFDTFYPAAITVRLSADCNISGLESLKYQKVDSVFDYAPDGSWIDYDAANGIPVAPSEKFVIFFRAEDRAGNVTIVNSTGIVVDDQRPTGETDAPEIDILPEEPNLYGYHKNDVTVDIRVLDPQFLGNEAVAEGYYSGLKEIIYKIYTTDTTATETGVLLNETEGLAGATFDGDNLISAWRGQIVIDADVFNSNNVIVEITAVDNAGNSRTSSTKMGDIQIDVTYPTIRVTYDNDTPDNGVYFKDARIATIVITERNFDPDDVTVVLKNSDGVIPAISAWAKTEGVGNKDNTTWTATILYTKDGDYEFSISFIDRAGWRCGKDSVDYGTSVAPTAFTIDRTAPTVSVEYDNDSVKNSLYYNADRIATVTITEHNLDPNGADRDRIVIRLTATDDGKTITLPIVSEWTTKGDVHTATVPYVADGLYTFDIEINDKAGNASEDFAEHRFYVDKTSPSIVITGVEHNAAYNGEVLPVITYSDTNFDETQVSILISGANRGKLALEGTYADVHNGMAFSFAAFAKEKEIDDLYTVTVTLADKAGNRSSEMIVFSINRFGSTYAFSESTAAMNNRYVKDAKDIVITETNVDPLSDIKITLFKNNETLILKQDTDYTVEAVGGNGKWYQYVYTVFAKNFSTDGVYSLTVSSNDKAGNTAKNDQDTKNMELHFGIDKTLPVINIENLENNKTYAVQSLTVGMSVEDNLKLSKVIVELDGEEFRTWSGDALEEIMKNGGNFTFDIAGDSTDAHRLVVYAIDEAGNGEKLADASLPANAEVVENFFVTTNLWVRFYTNKPLFFGSIAAVVLAAGAAVAIVVVKKRKKS